MTTNTQQAPVVIIGGGVVGAAILFTLAHRGVRVVLLEAESGLAYGASGTNSGILHTGFDSTPGELETELILRSAQMRPAVLDALGIPVLRAGAELVPHRKDDHDVIESLARNAEENGVDARTRDDDGALIVPGEWITDPVAYTTALVDAAVATGSQVSFNSRVVGIAEVGSNLRVDLDGGNYVDASIVVNTAGLFADDVAHMVGDSSFSIYPRKGEFLVFELPRDAQPLEHIVLPVPTKRTKGVLVFPTIDGKVAAGPTAVDLDDKLDWAVRGAARNEILDKAVAQFPQLDGLEPIACYAGLRPAGRESNYVIGRSDACDRMINVGAIRSTGLSASLGIGDYVAELLPALGIELGAPITPVRGGEKTTSHPWWQRTAHYRGLDATVGATR